MSQWVAFEESRKHMRVFKMQHYCEIPTPKGTLRGFFHKPNPVSYTHLDVYKRQHQYKLNPDYYHECMMYVKKMIVVLLFIV